MLKITSADRFVMASPNQGWSLELGANHFDDNPPPAVVTKLKELTRKGFVTAELLDLNANSSPWDPDAKDAPVLSPRSAAPTDPVTAMSSVVASKSVLEKK